MAPGRLAANKDPATYIGGGALLGTVIGAIPAAE